MRNVKNVVKMKCGSWPLPLTKKAARSGSRVKLTSFPVHVGKKQNKNPKESFFRFFFSLKIYFFDRLIMGHFHFGLKFDL